MLTRNSFRALVGVFDPMDKPGGLQLIEASFSFTAAEIFDRFS